VLGDEMAGKRVKRASEKTAHQKVDEWAVPPKMKDQCVKGELHCDVDEVNASERLGVMERRAKGVEKNLEGGKYTLSKD
jgi:hypothetical protein